MKKFNRVCYTWFEGIGSKSNKSKPKMPEVKPSADEPKRYQDRNGVLYILRGYVGTAFGGSNYTLAAYSPENKNSNHEVHFMLFSDFNSKFKEVKEEYEYQWLMREANGTFSSCLAFNGRFETEDDAPQRFEDSAMMYMIDHREYELVKIEETKRLRKI